MQARCPVCKSSQWNTCPQCNLLAWSDSYFFSFLLNLLRDFINLNLQMSGLQIAAFISGLAGLGATFGATMSNEWRATSRASSVITATWVLQGLWNNCAGNAIGAVHCRPHHTILKLEGKIRGSYSDHVTTYSSVCYHLSWWIPLWMTYETHLMCECSWCSCIWQINTCKLWSTETNALL